MQIKTQITRWISGLILVQALHPLRADPVTGLQRGERAASLRPDLEFDPAPYFEHGYSGHAGVGWSHWRLEAEILRTDVPGWLETNHGFDVSYRGGGGKVQYFLSPQQKGTFLGVRTEVTRETVRPQHTDLKAQPLLNLSERTLQRKLEHENTTFAKVLDDLRHDLGLRYLKDGKIALAEIAYLPFHRAFRRWTGSTPHAHRKQA